MARLVVITGPSGVGKGTLIRMLLEQVPGLVLAVSATTRSPRPGEENGREYHFLDDATFDRLVAEGRFLEHAEYAGNRYGTLRSEVEERPDDIRGVVLEIETVGAEAVAKAQPDAIRIFIAPPNDDALRDRLHSRGTDTPEAIERRLLVARDEVGRQAEFDTVIINDEIDSAASELVAEVALRLH